VSWTQQKDTFKILSRCLKQGGQYTLHCADALMTGGECVNTLHPR